MQITKMREERKKRGWTQEYVAEKIGLTRTAVHDIETLKQLPSYKILLKLEDLFGLTHRELFEIIKKRGEENVKAKSQMPGAGM